MATSGASNSTITLPRRKAPEEVSDLVSLMEKRGASSDGTVSMLARETLVKTAQIVASIPESGSTPERQYNWISKQAWIIDGEAVDRGPFWGEHLVQNSQKVHEYVSLHFAPPITKIRDIDLDICEYLERISPTARKKISRAKAVLDVLEESAHISKIITDLTGNSAFHSLSEKTSNFMKVLKEIGVEDELTKKSPNIKRIKESLESFHQTELNKGRIRLYTALPGHVKEGVFVGYPVDGTDAVKADFIQQTFENAEPNAFDDIDYLELCRCNLRILPIEIGRLNKLERLDLAFNKLSSLPDVFDHFIDLEALLLNDNRIESIPASFESLITDEDLELFCDLSNNKLRRVPEYFEKRPGNSFLVTDHIPQRDVQAGNELGA